MNDNCPPNCEHCARDSAEELEEMMVEEEDNYGDDE
jgi:hypothetical protein